MRSSKTISASVMLPVLVAILGIGGCCTFKTSVPAGSMAMMPEQESSADFLDRASEIPVMDMDNALRGMLLLVTGKDDHNDFQARVSDLASEGIVAPDWQLAANQPLTKGRLAYMVYRACGVKEKGLMLALMGPSLRYCLRELQYRGMMAEGDASMPVTGMEFVGVITRADVYQRTGRFPNDVGQPD